MTQTLLHTLKDGLIKKKELLIKLTNATDIQAEAIRKKPADLEEFDRMVDEKEVYLEELLKLDGGFDAVYNNIKDELALHKYEYESIIKEIKALISEITDMSVKLRAKEQSNKNAFDIYLSSKRSEIKNFKLSNKTVTNYYKNMSGAEQGQSYFMDKKK